MPEHNRSKNVLIGAMTIAMIVIGVFIIGLVNNHKVNLGIVTVEVLTISSTEVRGVLGTVEKISGQEVTLKNVKNVLNTGGVSVARSVPMIITVDQSTVIERFTRKDMLVFAKELDAFGQNKARSTSTPPKPPVPYTLEKVTLSDIKVGDIVTASSAKDIATLTTFTATTIAIQKAAIGIQN